MSEQYDYSILDFTLDGVSASSKGIKLCRPISFSAAVPRMQTIQIPGRSGDLHINEGAFNARTGSVDCFVIDVINGSSAKMAEVAAFLLSNTGYRKLTTPDDPEHYWIARVSNAAQIASRLGILAPFSIEFDCQPFRYTQDAETIITYVSGSTVITNTTLFDAFPLLYITATGAGAISNSNGTVNVLEATGQYELVVDCEDMRAYYDHLGGIAADHIVTGNVFPYFSAANDGSWGFTITGDITQLRFAPRWRTL